MKTFLLFIVVSVAAFGQTAKVIALEKSDSDKAAKLHEAVKKAEAELREFNSHVEKKYTLSKVGVRTSLSVYSNGKGAGDGPLYFAPLEGWSSGFEFTEDWKFIVPKQKEAGGGGYLRNCWGISAINTNVSSAGVASSGLSTAAEAH